MSDIVSGDTGFEAGWSAGYARGQTERDRLRELLNMVCEEHGIPQEHVEAAIVARPPAEVLAPYIREAEL